MCIRFRFSWNARTFERPKQLINSSPNHYDFPCLVDEIAEPHPDMYIKVTAFIVSKKFYYMHVWVSTWNAASCRIDEQRRLRLKVSEYYAICTRIKRSKYYEHCKDKPRPNIIVIVRIQVVRILNNWLHKRYWNKGVRILCYFKDKQCSNITCIIIVNNRIEL